jgi:phospholipid-binding lipoprotein MlaA
MRCLFFLPTCAERLNPPSFAVKAKLLCAAFFALGLMGCATGPTANPTDPLEPFNRQMFAVNEAVDAALLKPVARGYRAVTPAPIRTGITNFFNNMDDLWSAVNGVLQLRPLVATDNFMRFGINSTLGLGGFLDIATEIGIERHNEDLGKTLGRWGIPAGPFLVMPLIGPSTLRDAATLTTENRINPVSQIDHAATRNSTTVLRIVDTRSNLLRLTNLLDEAALDKYSFTRDAYLQRRRAEIFQPGLATSQDESATEPAKPRE